MQATWNQWGAQAAAGVATNVAGFSMPPPTSSVSTASSAAAAQAAAVQATPALGAFSMGSYPLYNAQAAALNPAMTAASATAAGVAAAGYTPQQWAMAQQQNWQQWEQWQQQYAQWQQQYGEKYQAHVNASMGVGAVAPVTQPAAKPPLPPTEPQQPPPPTAAPTPTPLQYDSGSKGAGLSGMGGKAQEELKRSYMMEKEAKDDPKKLKTDDKSVKKESLEELAEAEKAFDQQFKNWESQFLRWKEQNINHPDKNQYKEYEAKWESWREQLLERREQMKKRREAKEASIKAAQQAAIEAAAKEAKKELKNETPAVSAASLMSGMGAAAAGSMNPAMFQMNAALNPAAAMAGFGAYGYPGYGAFPGMSVPPPGVAQGAASMAQFPGMGAAAALPETNSAPLDFLKSGSKGIPGLDLVGQDEDKADKNDSNRNAQERNDYSGRDLNKPLTTSDDKPFQFPPPVGQMPPFMAQSFGQKPDMNQQVNIPPPFMPNASQLGAGMFSGPPPDGFGYPGKGFPAEGPPPTMPGAQGMYGVADPQQMFAGMQNSGYPGAPSANTFDQNDPQGRNLYGGDKSNSYDSQSRFGRGSDSQSGGQDSYRSQNNYFEPSSGNQSQRNTGKSSGLLPTPPAGFNRFAGGNNFSQGGGQDSSQYGDDDFEGQSNGAFNRNSFNDSEYSDSYGKFKGASPMKPPFETKSKPPGLMDSYDPSKAAPGSRDFGDKGFSQRSRSRFDDPSSDSRSEADNSKPVSGGILNNAGSLLRPTYLLEKKEALERIRNSAGLAPPSASGGLGNKFSRDSPQDDFRSKGQFDNSRSRDSFDDNMDFGQFDSPNSRDPFADTNDPFDESEGRGNFDEPRSRGRFDEPRGRAKFDEPRGRGSFDEPRGRGKFDEPRGRGSFDEARGRGSFDEPRGRGSFDEPRGRGSFDEPRGRGSFDEPRGRGSFDEPTGRGTFDEPRGKFNETRGGRGMFDEPRGKFNETRGGRGRFDGPDRGFDNRNKFDMDKKYGDENYGPQRPPFRDENQSPGMEPGGRGKWGRPGSGPVNRFEPPPVRPRLEEEFLRPSKVIDYNHKRIEPDFFEPSTITDYGHGISNYSSRSSAYEKGVRRGESDDKNQRQRHSQSPLRRSPPRKNSPPRRSPIRRSSPNRSSYHRSPSRENISRSPNRRHSPNDRGNQKKSEHRDFEKDSSKKPEHQTDSAKQKSDSSNPSPATSQTVPAPHVTVSISDLLEPPGRTTRPAKIVIIIRGPPGSGKSYVAKLIKDKEVEMGGSAPRILSLDDYFVTEVEKEEIDVETNKKITVKKMEYVYEAGMDQHYRNSLTKAFRKTVLDGYFPFIIVESVFEKVGFYGEIIGFSKSKGFKVYICETDLDVSLCSKRNIHNRTEAEIQAIVSKWEKTPNSQTLLDIRPLLQSDSITEVNMEDISDEQETPDGESTEQNKSDESKKNEDSPEDDIPANLFTSKWELMEFNDEKKDRLDGLRKKRAPESSIRDWLQNNSTTSPQDDLYTSERKSLVPGKKRVRWADMEERHAVEKMRNLGFVVGQTDWSRMMDPSQAQNKLTQIKYI